MALLEAFEAAARHGSFTRAADELALTQSAVSRQVQALEAVLEVPLFTRSGRRIALTEIGQTYARELAPALARIRTASAQAMALRTGMGSLHLAILPTFGSKWLLPRLSGFYAQHPEVLIHLHSRIGEVNLTDSGLDAAITAGGDDHWPGLVAHKLLEDDRVVIASPDLIRRQPLADPEDLYRHVLLGVSTRPQSWRDWFNAHGLSLRRLTLGTQFEYTSHLIQAVTAGMGVGVVTRMLVHDELQKGTLVVPFRTSVIGRHSYYLIYPPQKENFPPLAAFRRWVQAQAQAQRGPDAAPQPRAASRATA